MLQRYKSHKLVEAGKFQRLTITGDGDRAPERLVAVQVGGQSYDVPANFAARGMPNIGDYLVRYDDGYLSWSPAKAFEEGYELVEDATGGQYQKPKEDPNIKDFDLSASGRQAGVGGAAPQGELQNTGPVTPTAQSQSASKPHSEGAAETTAPATGSIADGSDKATSVDRPADVNQE